MIKKSFRVLFLRVLGAIIFFGLSLFLTNFFSPELVGQYDLSRTILLVSGSVVIFGTTESIIYYSGFLTSEKALISLFEIYRKIIKLMFFLSIFQILIISLLPSSFVNNFFDKDIYQLLFKVILFSFFYGLTMLNIEALRAIYKIELSEYFRNIFRYFFFFIGAIILYNAGLENQIINILLLNFLILSILSTIFFVKVFKKNVKDGFEIKITSLEIFKKSYPMSISVISFILMQSVDILFLAKYYNFEKIAFYSVAVKLTVTIGLVLSSINAVYAAKFAELFNTKKMKELQLSVRSATRMIAILTLPIIFVLLIFGNFFLSLFGNEYVEAKEALIILLVGQAVNALSGSVGVYMNMTNRQKVYQKIILISFVFNIILNWYLVPNYGLNGAAFATAFSLILWNVIGVIYIYNTDQIKTYIN